MEDGRISYVSELDDKGFAEGAKNIQRRMRDLTANIEKSGSSIDEVFDKIGTRMKQAFAVSSIVAFEKKIIEVRSEMESLQKSFESLAGERIGKQLYEDIKQFATSTPMMMKDLAKGAQTLLGFNIEAQKVMPILKQIGDISMGDAQKFNSLTLAFAQMSSTGKLMGQDLLQMINAGFNPLVVISEKTGKSVAKLKEEMSEGKITVEMVEEAFRAATAEGGKFHNMLETQSKTMKGALSNLHGVYEDMLNKIGEKQQGLMLKGVELAQTLVQNYEKVGQVLLGLITTYGTYRAAVMAVSVAEGIASGQIVLKTRALRACAAAQALLNKTMLANPYVLAATALGVLVGSIIAARDGLTDAERAQRDYNATLEEAKRQQEEYNSETEKAIGLAQDESAATEDREGAMQTLISRYPEIIKKYIDEKGHLTDILNLKREIAAYDGKLANLDNKTRAEMYTRYIQVIQKAKRGEKLNETEFMLYQGAQKKYNDATPWYNKFSGDYTNKAVDYFRNLAKEANRAYGRGNTVEKVTKFMESMGEMKTKELEALTKSLRDSEKKLDGKLAVKVKELDDYLERSDLDSIITKAEGIIEARNGKKKEQTDKEKAAAAKAAEKAAKDAEKAAKESAAEREKLFELELADEERQAKQKAALKSALADKAIAEEKNASKRELMQMERDHKERLDAIDRQAEEYKKEAYEAAQKKWEALNKGKAWADTEEAQAGWQAMKLTAEQEQELAAKRAAVDAEYYREKEERRRQDLESMYEYLKEYGNYEEKRKAIIEEYDAKIEAARENEWDRKALQKQKEATLKALKEAEFQKSDEYLKFFSALYSLTSEEAEDIGEKIRENLDESLKAGTISAQEYYEAIEKIDEQLEKIQKDRGSFMAFLEGGLNGLSSYYTTKGRDKQRAGAIQVSSGSQGINEQMERLKNGETVDFSKWAQSAQAVQAGEQMQAAGEAMSEAGGEMAQCIAVIDKIINGIDAAVQGLKTINDEVKEIYGEDYGLNKKDSRFMDAFSNASSGAASGWNSLKNGDIQGAVQGTIQSWTSWLKMENDDTAHWKELDEYLNKMESALSSIDARLKERVDMINGNEAQEAGRKLIADYQALAEQTKKNAQAWLDASTLHKNHSNWWYVENGREGYGADGQSWLSVMPELMRGLGLKDNGTGLSQLMGLNKEQMLWVQEHYRELWIRLPEEFRGYMEQIISYGEQIEQTQKDMQLANIGLDLESLKSDYAEFLTDLDADNKELAKNFEGYLRKALMSKLVGDKYTQRIQELINFADQLATKAAEEGRDLTQEELQSIREMESQIRSDLASDKSRYASLYGWTEEDSDEAKKYFEDLRDSWKSTLTDMSASTEDWKNTLIDQILGDLVESTILDKPFDKMIDGEEKHFDNFQKYLDDWTERYKGIIEDQTLTDEQRNERLKALIQEQTDMREQLAEESKAIAEGIGKDMREAFSNSLDNLGDTLLDNLLDSEKDAADMGKEIAQTLIKEMLAEMLASEKYATRIDKIRQMWQDILTGKDTEHTYADVLAEISQLNDDIANDEAISALADTYRVLGQAVEESKEAFSGLHDSFLDALTDMEGDADSFRKKMKEMVLKDVIDKQVLGKAFTFGGIEYTDIDYYITEWNKRYTKALEEGNHAAVDALIEELVAVRDLTVDAASELRERLKQSQDDVADTTFSDMGESWVSALMDMSTTAEDWSEQIGKTMVEKIMKEFVMAGMMQPLLDNLQKAFDTAVTQATDKDGNVNYGAIAGNALVQNALTAISDAFPDLRQVVEQLYTQLGITFEEEGEEAKNELPLSSLRDTVLGSLTDLDTDAAALGRKIAIDLLQEMLETMFDKKYTAKLDDLREYFQHVLDGDQTLDAEGNLLYSLEQLERDIDDLITTAGRDKELTQLSDGINNLNKPAEEAAKAFENLSDTIVDSLTDAGMTAEKFAENIAKTLAEQMMKSLIETRFKDTIADIQEDWAKALANGDSGALEDIKQRIIELYKEAGKATEEFEELFKELEKAATTPFDNLKDEFVSNLMDMKATADDLGNEIGKTLVEQMIRELVLGEAFEKQVEEWKKSYRTIMGTAGLSDEERARQLNALKSSVAAARDGYVDEARMLQDIFGTSTYPDQNATVNMADKATYDQFETWLGIAVSQQICGEQQLGVQQQILSTLQAMGGITSPNNDALLTQAALANSHLTVIREYSRKMCDQLEGHMASIDSKLSMLDGLRRL